MKDIDRIQPPDCYVRARELAADVELVRQEMGRPEDRRQPVSVRGASPREVYFEALALFRKADRLCAEIAGDPIAVPHAPPMKDIKPGHVLAVLDAAARELRVVKERLGITEEASAPARDDGKTPSDVLGQVATTARQVNLLLETPLQPADCYQQVALAVGYATRLGAAPGEPAALERRTRPADCYDRLLGCLDIARSIVRRSGHPVLEADPSRGDAHDVVPSDVYDLAALVLAEVAFLHSLSNDPNPPYPFEVNLPGRRLPSHVYQLAGVLDGQLRQLAAR